jgi:ribonuclease HI
MSNCEDWHYPDARLCFDGGITKNPGGQMSYGFVASIDGKEIGRGGSTFDYPVRTNIVAELTGLIWGLRFLAGSGKTYGRVRVYGDCKFVLQLARSKKSISKKKHLRDLHKQVRAALDNLGVPWTINWVRREENTEAHDMAH